MHKTVISHADYCLTVHHWKFCCLLHLMVH